MYTHKFLVTLFGLVTTFGGSYKIVLVTTGPSNKPGHQYTYLIDDSCEVITTIPDIEQCYICQVMTKTGNELLVKMNIEEYDHHVLVKIYNVAFTTIYKTYTFEGTDYDEFLRLKLAFS